VNSLQGDDQGAIVITGATGWVGRTVIDQLHREWPEANLQRRLRAFSSQAGLLPLGHGQEVPLQPLVDLPRLAEQEPISALIHCAFLTPDRLAELGPQSFVDTNRAITDQVCAALRLNPEIRVVTFSSGAARLMEERGPTPTPATALYGELKLEEERRVSALATTLVLRIYALTGRHIRHPRRYALGDFLHHALAGEPIVIQSKRPVIRGYGHADAIAGLAIRWVLSSQPPPPSPLATVSHTLELVELAETIAKIYGQPAPVVPVRSEAEGDLYTAPKDDFLEALRLHDLPCLSLEDQIRDTANGYRARERRREERL
jgi:nucleoside-diphosphate-sugar epimerase